MANSRLEKLGSIFSRMKGLIRAGAIKKEDRPIWYDVYLAFPPKREPTFERIMDDTPIRPIFYQEDVARGYFWKKYGCIGTQDLFHPEKQPTSEIFASKWMEIMKTNNNSNHEEAFLTVETSFRNFLPEKSVSGREETSSKNKIQ